MPKKQQTLTPAEETLAAIGAAVGQPCTQDNDHLVAVVRARVARAAEANAEATARRLAEERQLIAERWLYIARDALGAIAAGGRAKALAALAAAAVTTLDAKVAPREPSAYDRLPPIEGEVAEVLARLERAGGVIFGDLSVERRAPVYEIRPPLVARVAPGIMNASLAYLRYAVPMWERLAAEAKASELDPARVDGEISPAALVLWAGHVAEGRSLGGAALHLDIPSAQLLALLGALQRAARELELGDDEFEALARLGRHLQNHLVSVVPPIEGPLMVRWGTQRDRVYPPTQYADEPAL
jgi:hypothetical protein